MTNLTARMSRSRFMLLLALAPALALLHVDARAGSAPANDNWAAREIIGALPYPTDFTGSIVDATVEASDPPFFCRLGAISAGVAPAARTIWYGYTSGAQIEYVNLAASGYDTLLAVYSGNPVDGFVAVAGGCNDNGGSAGSSRIDGLRLAPSTAYSIVVAAFDGSTPTPLLQFDATSARIFAVSKTDDTRDGSCDADCSVREAIDASNADPGAVVIPGGSFVLTRGGSGEDGNATGDLDVRRGMGIYGADSGATAIDGNNADRVLHIDPAALGAYTVVVADLRLSNGNASLDGGGIANPAATLANADFVQLAQVRLDANRATQNGGGAQLGGISWLLESSVDGNIATLDGGGVYLRPPTAAANVRARIERSTISLNQSNRASVGGGGGINSALDLAIVASTLSGNRAVANGGGVLAEARALALIDSTVADNVARSAGGGAPDGGGVAHVDGSLLLVRNSIIASNRAGAGAGVPRDCFISGAGTLVTSADSLVQAPGACLFAHPNDVTGVDPQLQPLADNGGTTRTQLLADSSPAIDTGAACLPDDQRGIKRPRDGDGDALAECDRGAVEMVTDLMLRNGFEGP